MLPLPNFAASPTGWTLTSRDTWGNEALCHVEMVTP